MLSLDVRGRFADLVASQGPALAAHARFSSGAQYGRERLHSADGWELWLCAWLPGQASAIHDHGPTFGWNTVLAGTLLEETYELVEDSVEHLTTCRREVGAIDRFDRTTIHRVTALDAAVSLHLYLPRYEEGRCYEVRS